MAKRGSENTQRGKTADAWAARQLGHGVNLPGRLPLQGRRSAGPWPRCVRGRGRRGRRGAAGEGLDDEGGEAERQREKPNCRY